MSGQVDRAIETGKMLLARLGPPSPQAASLHLGIARAAIAGARWAEAAASIEVARESPGADTAQIDACAAQVAAGRGRLEEADQLARAALRAAEGGSSQGIQPEVACEALEVIGRVARQRDLEAAERAFTRAADLAERARAAAVAAARAARARHHRPAQDRERGPAGAGARASRGPGRAGPDRDARPADRRRAQQAVPRRRGPGGGPAVGGRVPPLSPGHAADGADLPGHRARHPRRGTPDGGQRSPRRSRSPPTIRTCSAAPGGTAGRRPSCSPPTSARPTRGWRPGPR